MAEWPNEWDTRYDRKDYVYGTAPNAFLASQVEKIPAEARVLSLGEGEGRNAVFVAKRGHAVEAVDGSFIAMDKARALAAQEGGLVWCTTSGLDEYGVHKDTYGAVLLIFCHLPEELRKGVHERARDGLAPGGVLILEAFTPAQIPNSSGGPKDPALLYTAEMIRKDFEGLEWEILEETETVLDEGPLHQGKANVVRALGRKPLTAAKAAPAAPGTPQLDPSGRY